MFLNSPQPSWTNIHLKHISSKKNSYSSNYMRQTNVTAGSDCDSLEALTYNKKKNHTLSIRASRLWTVIFVGEVSNDSLRTQWEGALGQFPIKGSLHQNTSTVTSRFWDYPLPVGNMASPLSWLLLISLACTLLISCSGATDKDRKADNLSPVFLLLFSFLFFGILWLHWTSE